ncbi:SH3 domain-containing protein 21 isoform X2 [Hypomesus transpacificus]|uniref:SH3 domain-containing protein 21 isoform X2 n=1 Tax=Hypomesus transpacificus TaxID=137520 RepID=UPI001F076D4E|nr:SH3 domain-containing protein 21 isoform X2 [Hypomesus transpacificus]
MEVLVLIDFEGTMGDEMTVRAGEVVKKVTKAGEEGWLEGELKGKKGIFPANFVKEIPVYLIGDTKREPRSLRKSKVAKQSRKCEVAFPYSPLNKDELELVVGETVEILREIEDGWWMGMKDGQIGAFPSNFVKEIFVSPKDLKQNEGRPRPKLSDAVFSKENKLSQRTSVRNKAKNVKECCQVMFDYSALTDDELSLQKGDMVTIISKDTEDEGWWEGELNGHRGFFPDNFVMVIPTDTLQSGSTSLPPVRKGTERRSVKVEASAMEKGIPAKPKDEKAESKDLRANPPTKVKLPSINRPSPPPVKDKPAKPTPRPNGALPLPSSPNPVDEGNLDQFDGVDVSTEKLSHPTATRAKPPQRRPPSGPLAHVPGAPDLTEAAVSPNNIQTEKIQTKVAENLAPTCSKAESQPRTPPPARPAPPKAAVEGRGAVGEGASQDGLQAEVKELRMALELLQALHVRDIQELKEELKEERTKRTALQEEVQRLLPKR